MVLEQLEASRPAREQQKHAEFQQLAINVANEVNMDVEAIPAALERLGRTTDERRGAVEKYPKRLAAHHEIETAQAAAERMSDIQQELENIEMERVRINQELYAKARPFVQEREQAVTAISKGTYSEEYLRSTCTDPVRLAALAAVEEQRQEIIRSRDVVVQRLRDRDIWLLQVSQWGKTTRLPMISRSMKRRSPGELKSRQNWNRGTSRRGRHYWTLTHCDCGCSAAVKVRK